eukprot:CAMPEP_0119265618 /NCGR_PEP_ID=MMETSP1329-20130426/4384_1 /TAXON_ID=114041 /ORGANISM="Genus nov. species nov., Strain RCC1024" /LENGTH=96 /DNA_ID=CAMNT_0007265457 /DNA_START=57 /DNA_END=344 /DNA_ORIENTATION=-
MELRPPDLVLAEDPLPEHSPPRPTVWKQSNYPVGCDVLAKDPTQLAGYYVGKVVAVLAGETPGPPGTLRVQYYDGQKQDLVPSDLRAWLPPLPSAW